MNDDNNQSQGPAVPYTADDNVLDGASLPTVGEADAPAAEPVAEPAAEPSAEPASADSSALDGYSDEELLLAFAEQLIAEKGEEDKFGTKKHELKDKMKIAISNAIVAALPDDKVDELNAQMDNGADAAAIAEAVKGTGIDLEKITEETMGAFRDDYLSGKEL